MGTGTAAQLAAAGIGPGDEVVVPSFVTTAEAAEAVRRTGAIPVFADIDPVSLCLDPAAVADAVTPRTAAVVAVELFGHSADLTALQLLAADKGLALVTPTDPPLAHVLSSREIARRQAGAAYLGARLTGVVTPSVAPGAVHEYHAYVVRVPGNGRPDRDAFARALRARGVRCRVPVPTPVHRLPLFRAELWLPETERAAGECLALPLEGEMSRRELQRIVSAANALGGLLPAAA
ncbi:DegT/DnrJ/EryC1/StrS family aminotransferase [Streptomyces sp. NPDC049555]|uniref:DegT/DnrJ/EryC1/StrS family aminotransferase n=1 Tax=unclassified Streptomyces TaxID=2593676 RepID=UPI003413BC3D